MEMNLRTPIKVLVTGANGKIAYNLVPHLLSGSAFGRDQPIILHLLSRNPNGLQGLVMEIEDCIFPLHHGTLATLSVAEAFTDIDVAILLASVGRGEAKIRRDLLALNVPIIHSHGKALQRYAKPSAKVLVVTNPCNTMTHVCRLAAPSLVSSGFTCLTQVDHNRALYQMRSRAPLKSGAVTKVGILGNHSDNVAVCLVTPKEAECKQDLELKISEDEEWMIQKAVQSRGGEVISKTRSTSVVSVTAAIIDHLRAWFLGTERDNWVSMGLVSDGSLGVPSGLICSFPVKVSKDKEINIVKDVRFSEHTKSALDKSIRELQSELNMAANCLASLSG